jgi:hypothetical protein
LCLLTMCVSLLYICVAFESVISELFEERSIESRGLSSSLERCSHHANGQPIVILHPVPSGLVTSPYPLGREDSGC